MRLLSKGANEKGDLFTRLTRDIFFSLGYDNLRINVVDVGREIDISGKHRFEQRSVLAECKAHSDKVGGAELNKFYGVLSRERSKNREQPVSGYFLSLSGFTETAISQELSTGDDRVALLDSAQIADELERSRVVVSRASAIKRASECLAESKTSAELDNIELLAHRVGYIWCVYFSVHKQRTLFSLIHADGTPLASSIAESIIRDDASVGGCLSALSYLAPAPISAAREEHERIGLERYKKWLDEECGFIQLDGLPADTDLQSRRLKLERLFVPLRAQVVEKRESDDEIQEYEESIGVLLTQHKHLAILAMPGGGKSTLLKRLASAYAFPGRRNEISDQLPAQDWLPFILRCRELRDRIGLPIESLLDESLKHAGLSPDELVAMKARTHSALRSGKALILVDGLDEISDETKRRLFATQLRTFVAIFPDASLVITSRHAGFRQIAGVMASACKSVKLSGLKKDDVVRLCIKWHAEILGTTAGIERESRAVAETIWQNAQIRTLAENPLLLTTLLVVKRTLRELPKNRTALYREAIRVLVRTWNVEGYQPLDEDETLAQLSYVACSMMNSGVQQIARPDLLRLLTAAKSELDAELQFSELSPQQFIDRIEYRSSLLMQVGHVLLDGQLQPLYEFRHLTFQEYLSARGFFEDQFPNRSDSNGFTDLLSAHFLHENWREVITMATAMAGRKADQLIQRLIKACESLPEESEDDDSSNNALVLLHRCVVDEVQISPATLALALRELGSRSPPLGFDEDKWHVQIVASKFSKLYTEIVVDGFLSGETDFSRFMGPAAKLAELDLLNDGYSASSELVSSLAAGLRDADRRKKLNAILATMKLAFEVDRHKTPDHTNDANRFHPLSAELSEIIATDDLPLAVAASWALAWFGERRRTQRYPSISTLLRLWELWRGNDAAPFGRYFAWALSSLPLLDREAINHQLWSNCDDTFLQKKAADFSPGAFTRRSTTANAAMLVAWYRRSPWDDSTLVEMIVERNHVAHFDLSPTVSDLLSALGEKGIEAKQMMGKRSSRSMRHGNRDA